MASWFRPAPLPRRDSVWQLTAIDVASSCAWAALYLLSRSQIRRPMRDPTINLSLVVRTDLPFGFHAPYLSGHETPEQEPRGLAPRRTEHASSTGGLDRVYRGGPEYSQRENSKRCIQYIVSGTSNSPNVIAATNEGGCHARLHSKRQSERQSLQSQRNDEAHRPYFCREKKRSGTPLELELAGTVSASFVTGANGIRLEIRVNALCPNYKIEGSLEAGHLYDSIYTKSVYTALKSGTYKAQVYAQAAPAGTATGVILDPGGWGEAVLATEF